VFSNKAIREVLGGFRRSTPSPVKPRDRVRHAPCKPALQFDKPVETAIQTANEPVKSDVYQNHPKAYISRPLRVSEDQRQRIIDRYNSRGQSIRQIAKEEGRARQTVTRIVRSADASEYEREIEQMRLEFRSLVSLACGSLQRAMKKDTTGMIAARYLENIGVIQKRRRRR
jgi:transposase-like protein